MYMRLEAAESAVPVLEESIRVLEGTRGDRRPGAEQEPRVPGQCAAANQR